MEKIAAQTASQYADSLPLLITVHEHAGWWLQWFYSKDIPQGLIVGTANDQAAFSPAQLNARAFIQSAEVVKAPPRGKIPLAITLSTEDWRVVCGWIETLQQQKGVHVPCVAEELAQKLRKEHFPI